MVITPRGVFMGPVRVPPLPQYIVLTDRATGVQYTLIHDSTGTLIGITDDVTTKPDRITFGPSDGPWLPGDPTIRIIVRNAQLGYETVALPTGVADYDQARVLTRRALERKTLEIAIPTGWTEGDMLCYNSITI